MKIAYNNDGTLTTAALDSQEVSGENVATVADNLDVFTFPSKYKYISNAFVLAPRLNTTVSNLVVAAGVTVTVSVQALALGGAPDTSSTATVTVQHESGTITPESFSLVAGAASFAVFSAQPMKIFLFPYSPGMYAESVAITFTA